MDAFRALCDASASSVLPLASCVLRGCTAYRAVYRGGAVEVLGCTPPALCTLCIDVCSGAQVVSPSGHDALTVPCKQEVTVPPDARCTARNLEVLARRSQHRGAPAVRTWESELLSSLACLQCRVMPCITGAAGAQRFRRPVQQEHWTCLGCLRACAAGPAPEGAPGGTFRSISQDWDMNSKI